MDIKTLESFKLSDAVKFHDKLNPKLWVDNHLDPQVKKQLKLIAEDFLTELGIKTLDVVDITVSGSNAAYSYTPHSDIDLHILVDMNKLPDDEVYRELFNAKKRIYNDSHDIKIRGIPVELYVQDSNKPVVSLGEYSILNDKWIKLPKKRRAHFDHKESELKYNKLFDIVQHALKTKNLEKVEKTIDKIKQYRQAGLDKAGEFGPENLAYKAVRSQGLMDKLFNLRDKLHSKKLSIESQNEDYDPNSVPPGPEFKPTMPKGTVRVDVSDVYDWYKLGQHISNMKGLGKHDFGKGPPSTILSFGDEDTEHQYMQDLEKTGLSTTDIDPVDPKQPKGMKRQKVDPTFNVNESKKIYSDSKPKLIGLSFSDLEKLSESAGNNFIKFDRNISKKLNLPKHKGLASNTLNLFSVYRKQKMYESQDKKISDTEKKLFDIFNSRAKSTINSVKPGDSVSLLMLSTLAIPNDTIFANLQGFLNPKKIKSITNSNGIDYLHFVDGTKFPETDKDDPIYLAQTWAMTKLFDSYDSASTAYLMYALEGKNLSDEIQFDINVDKTKKQKVFELNIPQTLSFIKKAHGDQLYGTLPYWTHPRQVAIVGKKIFGQKFDSDAVKVAFLHDIVEDTHIGLEQLKQLQFDNKVIEAVELLTKDKSISYIDNIKNIINSNNIYAIMVKYADNYVNYTGDKSTWDPKRREMAQKKYLASMKMLADKLKVKTVDENASGYIPNNKQKNDPRYKTALTIDVKPDTMRKDALKFGNKISRSGIPPTLKP